MPLVIFVLIGVSIARRKSVFKAGPTASIAGIWLIAAVVLGSLLFHVAPQIEAAANATYPTVTRTLELKDFEKIDVGSDIVVNITSGKTYSVKLTGEEKYLEDADVKVNPDKTLYANTHDRFHICLFCFDRPLTLEVTMPTIASINGHGASNINVANFKTNDFDISLSGASDATLDLTIKNLTTKISGASDLHLVGTTDKATIKLSGASNIDARNFKIKSASIIASGSSDAYVNVSDTLEIQASGASNVYYSGEPKVKFDTSGSSDLEKF
jgi:hypothetical protein